MKNRVEEIRKLKDLSQEEHAIGWRFKKMYAPFIFVLQSCDPERGVYQFDYTNKAKTDDYLQLYEDYGWHYSGQCYGWYYFYKPVTHYNQHT